MQRDLGAKARATLPQPAEEAFLVELRRCWHSAWILTHPRYLDVPMMTSFVAALKVVIELPDLLLARSWLLHRRSRQRHTAGLAGLPKHRLEYLGNRTGLRRKARMVRRIPHVADGVLHTREPSGGPEIAVDSPCLGYLAGPIRRRDRSHFEAPAAPTPPARSAGRAVASIGSPTASKAAGFARRTSVKRRT